MKKQNNLGRDNVGTLVWKIAVPSMLAQFVSVLYSVVDRMYIGNIPEIGSVALAGVGVFCVADRRRWFAADEYTHG